MLQLLYFRRRGESSTIISSGVAVVSKCGRSCNMCITCCRRMAFYCWDYFECNHAFWGVNKRTKNKQKQRQQVECKWLFLFSARVLSPECSLSTLLMQTQVSLRLEGRELCRLGVLSLNTATSPQQFQASLFSSMSSLYSHYTLQLFTHSAVQFLCSFELFFPSLFLFFVLSRG